MWNINFVGVFLLIKNMLGIKIIIMSENGKSTGENLVIMLFLMKKE